MAQCLDIDTKKKEEEYIAKMLNKTLYYYGRK
jgi:hypothetical protein